MGLALPLSSSAFQAGPSKLITCCSSGRSACIARTRFSMPSFATKQSLVPESCRMYCRSLSSCASYIGTYAMPRV
jgi:hypothetical protein